MGKGCTCGWAKSINRHKFVTVVELALSLTCRMHLPMSEQGGDRLTYTYRPSLIGAPWSFTLADDGLHWDNGRRSGRLAYEAFQQVRLSFRPAAMQANRFMTEIWWKGGPKLTIVSTSWKSMVEVGRLEAEYSGFVLALHRRLAGVSQPIAFTGGTNPALYWVGIGVFVASALGLAGVAVRAVQQSAGMAALLIGAFLLFFLWQSGNFFRRNKPVRYSPGAVPPQLLP